MKRKLIYVSFVRLTDTVLHDYYIDYNIEKGAGIEFWDIVPLLRYDYDEKNTLEVDYLHYIKTYKEFDDLIHLPENQDAVYVMLISYQNRYIKPFKILSNNNCTMIYINMGAMPITKDVPRWQRIISRLTSNPFNFIQIVVDFLSLKLYQKLNIVKPFEIEFVAGGNLLPVNFHAKKVVPINFFDFDHYKRFEFSSDNIVDGKFILFIDHNAPAHSDTSIWINEDKYFKSINRIIGLIEESQNLKVVIAASPKSKYGSEKYEGREFYRLMTPALTKQAEYIIIPYASSVVSYAVLNFKPILFIYNDEVMKIWPLSVIEQENVAAYLNLEVYNSDLITHGNQLIIRQPSVDRYDSYKYNFLTSHESENLISSEIFWNEISKL